MQNLRHKKSIFKFIVIVIISTFMLISCANFGKSQKKSENRIITYQVDKLKKPYPKDRDKLREKTKMKIPKEEKFKYISAKKAFDAYKKYPGAKKVFMAQPANVKSVLSSSQALESLQPAMWWNWGRP